MFARFAMIALAAVTMIAGTLAAFAGDGGREDAAIANVELRKPDDAPPAELVEDDRDDRDDTAGDDGAAGGDNTGDGDGARGNDGTAGGDNTGDGDGARGNDGTAGGDNTAAAVAPAQAVPAQPAPAPAAPAPAVAGDDSDDGVSAGGATT
jgi:hypothetical protein